MSAALVSDVPIGFSADAESFHHDELLEKEEGSSDDYHAHEY